LPTGKITHEDELTVYKSPLVNERKHELILLLRNNSNCQAITLTFDPPGGHIWQIGVIPEQRRRGLASALLVATMRRMQEVGASKSLLAVHVNNPGAIQAYERLGYKTVGRRARYESRETINR